jgi:flagellar biosynthesis component FlhA
MDGASKFVRGDAIAGLLITAINMFGGIIIGYARHDMQIGEAADVFVRLSVGDGLVSQIPALIVSLAAGLLVSRGGQLGSTDEAVIDQLGGYPRALFAASGLLFLLALMPGLPFFPFVILASGMAFGSWIIPRQRDRRPAPRRRRFTAPSRRKRTRKRIPSSPSSRQRKSSWCLASRWPPSCSEPRGTRLPGRQDAQEIRHAIRLRGARDQGDRRHLDQGQELPDPDSRNHGGRQ